VESLQSQISFGKLNLTKGNLLTAESNQIVLPEEKSSRSTESQKKRPANEVLKKRVWPRPVVHLLAFTAIVATLFCLPLIGLARYAWDSPSASHILLLPFICGYLVRLRSAEVLHNVGPASRFSLILGIAGFVALLVSFASFSNQSEKLTGLIFSFVSFLIAGGFWFLGAPAMHVIRFPAALLFFMVPIPSMLLSGLRIFLQHTSADAAQILFDMTATPYLRDGLIFRLPGIPLQVAEECSGINSTLVLFIVSLIAGHLFIRTTWKRVIFTLVVIPLGILRNGFRVFTIAQLCINISPRMIDSPIHHRGGPIFFALSLVPLFLLLYFLRRSDLRNNQSVQIAATQPA
jgi:exosortase C (VPDSG-CTERM-specific)